MGETMNVELLQQKDQLTQVNRYLFAGYNSICLPMSLTAEQLNAAAPDVKLERLAALRQEGNVVNLYFTDCTADGIEAGVPYLIFSPKNQNLRAKSSEATKISTQLQPITLSDGQGNRVTFGSSWKAVKSVGRYGIPAKQDVEILESVLHRTDGEQTFLPTRCGFDWEAQGTGAMELQIKHIRSLAEIATGIEALKASNAIADIYDVNGVLVRKQTNLNQALQTLPRGIYVIEGEKVVVK